MKMNQAQKQALSHNEGPMLVLAGPGSGKTMVITQRTKHLIEEYKVPENSILVITFTKAAAKEMKERFLKATEKNHTSVSFGTFHAIFFTILKHAYSLNGSNIVREADKKQLMRELIRKSELEYDDENEFISDLFTEISLVKGNQIELDNYYSVNCGDDTFRSIYKEYNQRLRKARLIDFDDMLVLCHQLFTKREDYLKAWQSKYQYILVDEFQDINKIQYEIIQMLAAPQNNLFIVGDDDQSIYHFRGAKPEIMLNFPKDYEDCKMVNLDTNYRTTSNIISMSNRLIEHNKNRFPKKIKSAKGNGRDVIIEEFHTLAKQNQWLVGEILKRNKEGISFNEVAILLRTNQGFGSMLYKLMEYNIPFYTRDSLPNIFDHWIARDILSYLEIAMGQTDRSLYLRIINRPTRYVSRECFSSPQVDFEDVKDYYDDKKWMLERLDQFEYDIGILDGMAPYAAVNYIRKGIGYDGYLKEYAQSRKMKLEDLIDVLDELQETTKDVRTLDDWFDYIKSYKQELKDQQKQHSWDGSPRVTISTMHSSKGLEFEVVFIVDANEGIIPHKKAVLPTELEEERRLFYVAMTRAKEYLYISSAKERYNKEMEPSRFIEEIKEAADS